MTTQNRKNFIALTKTVQWDHIDVRLFETACLEKVQINKSSKLWTLHIKLPQVLPVAILKEFCERIQLAYTNIVELDWYFYYEKNNSLDNRIEDNIIEYWEHLIKPQLSIIHPCLQGLLSEVKYLGDKQLELTIANEIGKKTLSSKNIINNIIEMIDKYLEFDIDINIKMLDNTTTMKQYIETQQQLEQIYVQQALDECKQATDNKATINNNKAAKEIFTGKSDNPILLGKNINDLPSSTIKSMNESTDQLIIKGKVFGFETRPLKSGKILVSFNMTDDTDSIKIKVFAKDESQAALFENLIKNPFAKVRGIIQYDTYEKQMIMMAKDVMLIPPAERQDRSTKKRIELHLHTPMSPMDGVSSIKSLITTAAKWGHKAIAVTDHGVVQAFPDAYEIAAKNNIKLIYGVEAYVINDGVPIVYNIADININDNTTYVIFDTETTGLSAIENSLTEIAAVKVRNYVIIDSFQSLVKPRHIIPEKIEKLTGITNIMVSSAPTLESVMGQFLEFIEDTILVAHNANFDLSFINTSLNLINLKPLNNPVIDTVALARFTVPGLKSYKLSALSKHFDITLENHHRALDDATATAKMFMNLLSIVKNKNINNLIELNQQVVEVDPQKLKAYHTIILAKDSIGLKNLYKLISLSHIKYFHRLPRIPKSELIKHREGLIVGSACEAGELYQAFLLNKSPSEIEEIAKFFDYLEIQPLGNNEFMVKKGMVNNHQDLRNINIGIYQLGKKLNLPVVATGDVHFLNPADAKFREILMVSKGFIDAHEQPPLYLKTTEEMLQEFSYLGEKAAEDVVINYPEYINQQIDQLKPFPDELFTPVIEGADEQVRTMSYEKAKRIYGEDLPKIVKERLERELDSIIGNGFAVIYLISQKIVTKSLSDGYLVGSRGSVGSSFVATMLDITEVNPLPPHYVCPDCKKSIFITDGSIGSGFDLANANCPDCNQAMIKEGHDIPFETFMGFKGDKVPDIDLNFSGDYQPKAHKYVEELFGRDYVFRAGTISTIAEKTAYGYVQKYAEENNVIFRNAEIERLVHGCTGIKRTTGQHPGGQMVIPNYKDVHDFTPIQFPADDKNSQHYTTHFDYHAISGRLLKLDILGHDDPTVIRMLQDITGIEPKSIPLDDSKTMALFSSTESIGISPEELESPVATFAIPEFGTKFVRQMLEDTRPTTFAELVRISGLSHGTDVWLNNAQELIRDKKAVLAEVISTRDDIMVYLIHKGLEPSKAFKIMEKVRKGKGLAEEDQQEMKKHNIPDWYIWSCNQIKYMFPKAHAVAYVLMAVRIAYFKVHYPLAFYATYFTVRADDFEIDIMMQGKDAIRNALKNIQDKGNLATTKEKI